MTGGEAPYTYQWKIEDEIVGTNATLSVTASMLKKRITVTVTDAEGHSFTSAPTLGVGAEAALNEVVIDNPAPNVGETLTATALDADGQDITKDCTFQWYRVTEEGNTVKIANATKTTYTVAAIDSRNAVIYVVAKDSLGNEYTSNESKPVMAEDVTSVTIEGIGGKQTYSKINDVVLVGDELSVALSNADAESTAKYQWYRNSSAIKDATGQSYTVTDADLDTQIGVEIQLRGMAGYAFKANYSANAGQGDALATAKAGGVTNTRGALTYVSNWNVTAKDIGDSPISLTNTSPSVGQSTTVKVKFDKNNDGDIDDDGDYLLLDGTDATVAWYRGEAIAENKVGSQAGYTATDLDAGKELIAVVSGVDGTKYYGNLTIKTAAVTRELDRVVVDASEVVDYATSNGTIGERVTAKVYDKGNNEVKAANFDIQWYLDDAAINGATNATLQIDSAIATLIRDRDALGLAGTAPGYTPVFKAQVTGKNEYSGDVQSTSADATDDKPAQAAAGTARTVAPATLVKVEVKDGAGKITVAGDKAGVGESVSIVTQPAAAAEDITWTWLFGDTTSQETLEGTKVSVPNVSSGSKISVYGAPKARQSIDWDGDSGADIKTAAGTYESTAHVVQQNETDAKTAMGNSTFTTLLGLNSVSFKITNGKSSADAYYKEFDTPEVGTTVEALPDHTPTSLAYAWTYDEGGAPSTTNNVKAHIVTAEDLGKTLKCTVTANDTNGYSASKTVDGKTAKVVRSSRTYTDIKVAGVGTAAGLADVASYNKLSNVAAPAHNTEYEIIVLDSWGEIFVADPTGQNGTYVVLAGDNQKGYSAKKITWGINNTITTKATSAGQMITVMIVPDQINYGGSTLEYSFTSALS